VEEAEISKALQNNKPAQIIHISGMAEDERGIKSLDNKLPIHLLRCCESSHHFMNGFLNKKYKRNHQKMQKLHNVPSKEIYIKSLSYY
jgi:hypothetical protein